MIELYLSSIKFNLDYLANNLKILNIDYDEKIIYTKDDLNNLPIGLEKIIRNKITLTSLENLLIFL